MDKKIFVHAGIPGILYSFGVFWGLFWVHRQKIAEKKSGPGFALVNPLI